MCGVRGLVILDWKGSDGRSYRLRVVGKALRGSIDRLVHATRPGERDTWVTMSHGRAVVDKLTEMALKEVDPTVLFYVTKVKPSRPPVVHRHVTRVEVPPNRCRVDGVIVTFKKAHRLLDKGAVEVECCHDQCPRDCPNWDDEEDNR
jgi:hypothetical protein